MKKLSFIVLTILVLASFVSCSQIKARVASGQWAEDTRLGLHVAYSVVSVMCAMEVMDQEQCGMAAACYNETLDLLDLYVMEPTKEVRDQIMSNVKDMEALPRASYSGE